ncbi:MAG: segregation/condensation protein A [Clostridia bacterium]|nr:segregation/condensation protein A [Clostridia bacterium]
MGEEVSYSGISYKLEVFEGPLPLLLHLISKHKLNIYDIPIAQLVDQYTDYVSKMRELDLAVAGEFLEMAARLVCIKTLALLPKNDEAESMKQELTRELLAYRDCRTLAGLLSKMTDNFGTFVRLPEKLSFAPEKYTRIHRAESLLTAYTAAAGRGLRAKPLQASMFDDLVKKEIVPVSSGITSITHALKEGEKRALRTVFRKASSRSDMVALFLAVLEMCRAGRLNINEQEGEQYIELISSDAEVNADEFD